MNAPAHFDLSSASKIALASVNDNVMNMGSNIGRDVLKRAQGFQEIPTAVFEYFANAYESYNQGQRLIVYVDITKNKLVVRDFGVGMSFEQLMKYWTMHGETSRRENGLNLRGYNGTGKIAGYRIAEQIEVRTVKNGLRQITRLHIRTIEKAAANSTPIAIEIVEKNVPTSEENGTVITLSYPKKSVLPDGFNASFIRDIREKTAKEMMMWMKGAEFIINGVEVVAAEVPSDSIETRVSECGNFTAKLHHLEKGYRDELPKVFISIGGIFVAHELFGKENHRLGNRVHVTVDTTKEWCDEHFFNRRELFTSESRDLKLKANCPEAISYKNWIEATVGDYMKLLEEQENERRRLEMDEAQRELEDRLSRSFSALFRAFHKDDAPSRVRTPTDRIEITERTPRQPSKPKVTVHCEKFSTDEERYRCNPETMEITINAAFAHMRFLDDHKSVVYNQALIETGIAALVEMEVRKAAAKQFEETIPSLDLLFQFMADKRVDLERQAYAMFGSQFETFRKLSVTKTAADVEAN